MTKKVKAYKSPFTGEIFERKSDYNNHIEECKRRKKEAIDKKKALELKHSARLNATSLEDFRQRIIAVTNKLFPTALVDLQFRCFHFHEVSNSHNCPINGVTNWGSMKKDLPKSYLGWTADTIIIYKNEKVCSIRSTTPLDNFPAFNTCGGHGSEDDNGTYRCNYTIQLFLDDFPLIKKKYDKLISINKSHEKWNNEISKKINKKNNADKDIRNFNKQISYFDDGITKLSLQRDKIAKQRDDIMLQNMQLLRSKNKFKHLQEKEQITKELMLKN